MLEYQVFQQIKRFYPHYTGGVSSEEFPPVLLQPFSCLETPSPLAHAIGGCSYLHRYQGVIPPDRYFFMLYGWYEKSIFIIHDLHRRSLLKEMKKRKRVEKPKNSELENPGIDPGTSRMLSERSTIWASPPLILVSRKFSAFKTISYFYWRHYKAKFCAWSPNTTTI